MRSVDVQFHLLRDELVNFIAEVSSRYGLRVEFERFFPKVTCQVPLGADPGEAMKTFGHVDRVLLLYNPSESKKIERFVLNIGRVKDGRLEQSQFGGGTRDPDAYKILRKVALDLRRRTKPGVWVIGKTGAVALCKTYRVSEGAAEASRAGTLELCDIGFGLVCHVDPPTGRDEGVGNGKGVRGQT